MSRHICDCGESYSSGALVLACGDRNHGNPRNIVEAGATVKVEATPQLKAALESAVRAVEHDLPSAMLFELRALTLAVTIASRRA